MNATKGYVVACSFSAAVGEIYISKSYVEGEPQYHSMRHGHEHPLPKQ